MNLGTKFKVVGLCDDDDGATYLVVPETLTEEEIERCDASDDPEDVFPLVCACGDEETATFITNLLNKHYGAN